MDWPDPTPMLEPSIGVYPFSTAATCTPPSTTKTPQAALAPTGPTEGSSVVNNLLKFTYLGPGSEYETDKHLSIPRDHSIPGNNDVIEIAPWLSSRQQRFLVRERSPISVFWGTPIPRRLLPQARAYTN